MKIANSVFVVFIVVVAALDVADFLTTPNIEKIELNPLAIWVYQQGGGWGIVAFKASGMGVFFASLWFSRCAALKRLALIGCGIIHLFLLIWITLLRWL